MPTHRIIQGDCIEGMRTLPDASVYCCVTSPPYWGLRDYGHAGQIGLEPTPEAYVARMVEVFREVRRVLRDDGTCWVNLGDSYANSGQTGLNNNSSGKSTLGPKRDGLGSNNKAWTRSRPPQVVPAGLKAKDLVGIPWRVAFALQADGWWLRQDIIWHKPNPMPESVRDRCTKAHEYVFLMTKSERYYYDAEAVSEASVGREKFGNWIKGQPCPDRLDNLRQDMTPTTTRNRRSVWTVTPKPYKGAHFATMPPDLVEPCIKAGCPEQCCPVCGAGYERVTETQAIRRKRPNQFTSYRAINGQPDQTKAGVSVKTLGWQPGCDCAASGTISGTVLDPFAGSGTTLAVAAELGRSGIGCELNPKYIELANQRIADSREKVALFA